jgi:hypothetical protein
MSIANQSQSEKIIGIIIHESSLIIVIEQFLTWPDIPPGHQKYSDPIIDTDLGTGQIRLHSFFLINAIDKLAQPRRHLRNNNKRIITFGGINKIHNRIMPTKKPAASRMHFPHILAHQSPLLHAPNGNDPIPLDPGIVLDQERAEIPKRGSFFGSPEQLDVGGAERQQAGLFLGAVRG